MPKGKRTSYSSGARTAPYPAAKKARVYSGASRPSPNSNAMQIDQIVRNSFQETKYFDTSFDNAVTGTGTDWSATEVACATYVNGSGVSAAYTDSCLLPTAIGNAYGQVNGNRYKFKKIRVRGHLSVPVAADQADAGLSTHIRLMLVQDLQPNGAQAQGETVMQDFSGSNENTYSFKRVAASSSRFRILKDKIMILQPTNSQTDGANTGSVAWGDRAFSFQYAPRVPPVVSIASGSTTPTIASTTNMNVFMLAYAERAGSMVPLSVVGCSRVYYTD